MRTHTHTHTDTDKGLVRGISIQQTPRKIQLSHSMRCEEEIDIFPTECDSCCVAHNVERRDISSRVRRESNNCVVCACVCVKESRCHSIPRFNGDSLLAHESARLSPFTPSLVVDMSSNAFKTFRQKKNVFFFFQFRLLICRFCFLIVVAVIIYEWR